MAAHGDLLAEEAANSLLQSLEKTKVPNSLQIYQLGALLHSLSDTKAHTNLQAASNQLLQAIPLSYRRSIFQDIHETLYQCLLDESSDDGPESALAAVAQLHLASEAAFSWSSSSTLSLNDLVNILASKYHHHPSDESIIVILASLILYAFAGGDGSSSMEEQLIPAIHMLEEHGLWSQVLEHLDGRKPGWRREFLAQLPSDHRDYLQHLLTPTATTEPIKFVVADDNEVKQTSSSHTIRKLSPEQELGLRIDRVRQVLPDLGEGFVETALSYFEGNVEQTVAALLEDASLLPPTLQLVDRSLPRRHRKTDNDNDEEAKAAIKLALQAAERQQEEEAFAVEVVMRSDVEYNDDYDDQYDDVDEIGGADTGLYDVDYDAIRTYNRVLKGVVDEQEYWEANRNLNRQPAQQEKSFGPDKMRGGRIPNAGRGNNGQGGRGGRGRGRGKKGSPQGTQSQAESKEATDKSEQGKPNLRKKAAKLDKRREKQKQATAKRSG